MATEKKAKTAREALLMAARLIERQGWCKGTFARTTSGHRTSFDSEKAFRFCAYGALSRVSEQSLVDVACAKLREHLDAQPSIVDWNDSQPSKRPVVAALRKAAEL